MLSLVQAMAWRRTGGKSLSKTIMIEFMNVYIHHQAQCFQVNQYTVCHLCFPCIRLRCQTFLRQTSVHYWWEQNTIPVVFQLNTSLNYKYPIKRVYSFIWLCYVWVISVFKVRWGFMRSPQTFCIMMTSPKWNIFRVTGLLCGEFTGYRWIPRTKASDLELWCFLWSAPQQTVE